MAAPTIETADVTVTDNETLVTSQTFNFPAHDAGDLLVFGIVTDSPGLATTVTPTTTGPNGETITILYNGSFGGTSAERLTVGWWKASANTGAGTVAYTLDVADESAVHVVRVAAGEFDGTTPIDSSGGPNGSTTFNSTSAPTPSWAGTRANGRVLVFIGSDSDPIAVSGNPAGWTMHVNTDYGQVGVCTTTRDAATTASETIASATFTVGGDGDTNTTFGLVINEPGAAGAGRMLLLGVG